MDYTDTSPDTSLGQPPQEPAIWENLIPFWGMHARNKYAYERNLYEQKKAILDAEARKTRAWQNENVAKFYERQLGDLQTEAANVTTSLVSITDKLAKARANRALHAGLDGLPPLNPALYEAEDQNVKDLEQQYEYFKSRGVAVNGLRDTMAMRMGELAFSTPPPHAREPVTPPPVDTPPLNTGGFHAPSAADMPPPLNSPDYFDIYAQPAYASPYDVRQKAYAQNAERAQAQKAPPIAAPAQQQVAPPPPPPPPAPPAPPAAQSGPSESAAVRTLSRMWDSISDIPAIHAEDGKSLIIPVDTEPDEKAVQKQIDTLQEWYAAQYGEKFVLPIRVRYSGKDKTDAASLVADQHLLEDQAKSYESIGAEIRRYTARKAAVEAALVPEIGASMMYASLSAAAKGEDGEAPDPMMAQIASGIKDSKGNVEALRRVGEAMKKHLDTVIAMASEDRADYEPGYKAQQARLKKMGIAVTTREDRFYLKYALKHFKGKDITDLDDDDRAKMRDAWAKHESGSDDDDDEPKPKAK